MISTYSGTPMVSRVYVRLLGLLLFIIFIFLSLLYTFGRPEGLQRITLPSQPLEKPDVNDDPKDQPDESSDQSSVELPSSSPTAVSYSTSTSINTEPLPVPTEYKISPFRGPACNDRFGESYIRHFSDHAVSYCSPSSGSNITCFHSSKRADGETDSMCFARGATFDLEAGKFHLDCDVRKLSYHEMHEGLIPLASIRAYWYETGPPFVFQAAIDVEEPLEAADGSEDPSPEDLPSEGTNNDRRRLDAGASPPSNDDDDLGEGVEPAVINNSETSDDKDVIGHPEKPPRNFFLLKREGEGNPWHCIMEVFSAWMSFDVLRIARDPSNHNDPFFRVPEDVPDTQVVVLDDREDGPFFDLWTLFAGRKPQRLRQIAENPEMAGAIRDANLIVPLTGSSNPLWENDWEASQCASMPTVNAFVERILSFYNITDPPPRTGKNPIKITFIDRTSSRRLLNQEAMFEELKQRNTHISLQSVDFATISFAEQLQIIRDTDILLGVHGAGLTHALFMREFAGALVEIQPAGTDYYMFRNCALLRGLGYFRTRADPELVEEEQQKEEEIREGDLVSRGDWHFEDVKIDTQRFLDIVETAVKSLYGNGAWDLDVN